LHWSVPYNVKDDAGNHATTQYREVIVEEVDVESLEASIKKEAKAAKDEEIKRAVEKAVAEERRKLENDNKRPGNTRKTSRDCPPCPQCDVSVSHKGTGGVDGKIDLSICNKICEKRAQRCTFREESYVFTSMLWLESIVPTFLVIPVLTCMGVMLGFLALRTLFTLLFNPKAFFASNYDYSYVSEQEKYMQNSVTYYKGETPQSQQQRTRYPKTPYPHNSGSASSTGGTFSSGGGPPRTSMSADPRDNDGFFLSPSNVGSPPFGSPPGTNGSQQQTNGSNMNDPNDIYFGSPPGKITPRKGGELRKRSPFSS
jgi:hypothetical protein